MDVIVIEPYYGGSHKSFLDFLQREMACNFLIYTLPARKWKWRMRLAAPYFAAKLKSVRFESPVSAILCSPFLDVATFKALAPASLQNVPILTYFHENQFAYPVQNNDERDVHFALTNLTTIMASDKVAFNSSYNLNSLIAGAAKLLDKIYDMELEGYADEIRRKSAILYPAVEFDEIDRLKERTKKKDVPVIVWNHRWEHDKNPQLFFETLFEIDELGIDFRLNIIGENFRFVPDIFEKAKERLKNRIIQFGYLESREAYLQCLKDSDIVVSTAVHEFYGIAVIEAVRCGCRPLLPNDLAYPELFPVEYLYEKNTFKESLLRVLKDYSFSDDLGIELTENFSWRQLRLSYDNWLFSQG